MAANWSSTYGLPLALPPQQHLMPPHPPQNEKQDQATLSNAHQQPPTPGASQVGYNPLQPYTAGIPPMIWQSLSLNLHNSERTSEQMQSMPSTWPPPPLPTPEAWSQMHLHFPHLVRNSPFESFSCSSFETSNTPTHPQPLPQHNSFPHLAMLPTTQTVPASAIQSVAHLARRPAPENHRMDIVDSDKEEGEVSDGDRMPLQVVRNMGSLAVAPRSVPQDRFCPEPMASSLTHAAYDPNVPAAGQGFRIKRKDAKQFNDVELSADLVRQREEAKTFIRILHDNNIGYATLAAENLDIEWLKALFDSANVPTALETTAAVEDQLLASSPVNNASTQINDLQANITNKPLEVVISPTKPANPASDRKDYIARLQAVKAAKSNVLAVANLRASAPTAINTGSAAAKLSTPTVAKAVTKLPEDAKKARTTELIRQRLEALKKIPKHTPVSKPESSSLLKTRNDSNHKENEVPGLTAQTNLRSPVSNIPGLFMNATTVPSTPQATPEATPKVTSGAIDHVSQTNSRKRRRESIILEVERARITGKTLEPSLHKSINDASAKIEEVDAAAANRSEIATQTATEPTAVRDNLASSDLPLRPNNLQLSPAPEVLLQPGKPHVLLSSKAPPEPESARSPTSAVSTPGPQTPDSVARAKEMDDKAKMMAAVKLRAQQKLKEMMQRKKAAALLSSDARDTDSLTNRPGTPSTLQPATNLPISVETRPFNTAVSPPATNGDEMVRETKRRRRARITSDLPSLDAEIANNAARMAQLTKEMAELAAHNEKMKLDKQQLIRELENLGIDTEGMQHAELLAKKEQIQSVQQAASSGEVIRLQQTPSSVLFNDPGAVQTDSHEVKLQETRSSEENPSLRPLTMIPGLNASKAQPPSLAKAESRNTPAQLLSATTDRATISANRQLSTGAPVEHSSVETDLGNIMELECDTKPSNEEVDRNSPEPLETASAQKEENDDTQARDETSSEKSELSLGEDGEVDMSLSEDDYEPTLPVTQAIAATHSVHSVSSSSASSLTSSAAPTDDEEMYEPLGANAHNSSNEYSADPDSHGDLHEPITANEQRSASDLRAVPNIQEEMYEPPSASAKGRNKKCQTNIGSHGENETRDISRPPSEAPNGSTPLSPVHPVDQSTELVQSQRNGADLTMPEILSVPAVAEMAIDSEVKYGLFTPYQSPLKSFKSYRYHPNFSNDVPGGLLSMTYSHVINPNMTLCYSETDGGDCTDPSCPFQHFKDMQITGESLLVQLGTANPGQNPVEQQAWNDGLRAVLKDLRRKNIKDSHGIAMEITRYRREFLKDDTRIIHLEAPKKPVQH